MTSPDYSGGYLGEEARSAAVAVCETWEHVEIADPDEHSDFLHTIGI